MGDLLQRISNDLLLLREHRMIYKIYTRAIVCQRGWVSHHSFFQEQQEEIEQNDKAIELTFWSFDEVIILQA